MKGQGKKYKTNREKVDPNKKYALEEALAILDGFAKAKFDETVDIAVKLGIDAKQTDQTVRGSCGLPHGIRKKSQGRRICQGRESRRGHAGRRRCCGRRSR